MPASPRHIRSALYGPAGLVLVVSLTIVCVLLLVNPNADRAPSDKQAEGEGQRTARDREERDRKRDQDLEDAYRNEDFVKAARLVEQLPEGQKAEERRTLAARVMRTCAERKERGILDRDWRNARARVAEVRHDDRIRRSLTVAQEIELAAMLVELDEAHEKSLYGRLKQNPTAAEAGLYLTESPFRGTNTYKHRRDAAARLKETYGARSGVMEVTVALARIDWGKQGWAQANNTVKVWVDKGMDPSVHTEVVSAKDTSTHDIGQFQFRGKLDDPLLEIRIGVEVVGGNFIFNERTQGGGEFKTTIRELLALQELDLRRFGNKAFFKIVAGVPVDPPLPE